MRFGEIATDASAVGAVLAHTTRAGARTLKKGSRLGPAELEILRAGGVRTVFAATLEPGDVPEDDVAQRLGRAMAGPGVEVMPAAHGRCNVRAARRGLVAFDPARVNAANGLDWRMTVGTVVPHHLAEIQERVATVKVMPFAVDEAAVRRAEALLAEPGPLLRLAPFRPKRVGLVLSYGAQGERSSLDKVAEVQRARIGFLGSAVVTERRCPHTGAEIGLALRSCLDEGLDLVLFMGVSAVSDLDDVFPAALRSIGGVVEHVGMPVEPGNLLVLGHYEGRRVLGVPGCARSLKPSGFDWVVQRLLADLEVGRDDITRMGVGGLLAHGPGARPEVMATPESRGPAAVVLAAGSSRRMGPVNKVLEPIDGVPMVRRVVDRLLEAAFDPVVVVTGHQAGEVRVALAGARVRFAHNPDHEHGMGSSLAVGARALDDGTSTLVALADMPDVTTGHLLQLRAAYAEGGATVVAPTYEGRRGNPVLFDGSLLGQLRTCSGDQGARELVKGAGEGLRLVPVDAPGVLLDLDTPQALAERRGRSS